MQTIADRDRVDFPKSFPDPSMACFTSDRVVNEIGFKGKYILAQNMKISPVLLLTNH
jgi:hypothetical protein